MSPGFRLACIQTCSGNDMAENIAAASSLVREAHAADADLIALPECVAMMEMGRAKIIAASATVDAHPALAAFRALAAELGVWLLAGSLSVTLGEDGEDRVANRSFLLDRRGAVVAHYDKIHMFDVDLAGGESYRESTTYRPGAAAVLAETPFGRLGMTVCYDLRFPQLYRALAQAGAELLAVPSAFTRQTGAAHWHVLLRARATLAGSMSAITKPGSSPPSASTSPQGSTISEWPKVRRSPECRPHCAGAMTKQPVSIARARNSTCQWASPVTLVNAEGTDNITAPSCARARYRYGNRRS